MEGREIISVHELRSLAAAVFDKLSATGFESVAVDRSAYWSVFPSDAFTVDRPELVMSDVADDLLDLRNEANDPESPLSLGSPWHALHHLAGICSAMAAATLNPPTMGKSSS